MRHWELIERMLRDWTAMGPSLGIPSVLEQPRSTSEEGCDVSD